jgi:hypothetical protein
VIKSVEEFYDHIRTLIIELRAANQTTDADSVDSALHDSAIAGEIFDNLWIALRNIQPRNPKISEAIAFIDTFPLYG